MKNNYFIIILLFGWATAYAQPTTYGVGAGAGGNPTNSYFGVGAGANNTANSNTFVGESSGATNIVGIGNTFLGRLSGFNNLASFNTFTGDLSGLNTTSGQWNTFMGANSGMGNTTGSENVFIGQSSGAANTSGSFNTFVGRLSGSQSLTGEFNVFIGHSSGQTTNGNHNTFIGFQSGAANTVGADNTFMGYRSGLGNTTGIENVFIGRESGFSNTSGSSLAFVGASAGVSNTTGFGNTFVGAFSGYSNTVGAGNTFVGYTSGNANSSGYELTFLGNGSGNLNTTGAANTFIGHNSGRNNTTGSDNTYLGHYSAGDNTTGARNATVGARAGEHNTNGSDNTFLGFGAGQNNINGSGNVFLGRHSGNNETGSNLLYISNSNTNNPLVWGNFQTAVLNFGGNVGIGLNPAVEVASASLDVNGDARIRSISQNDTLSRVMVADLLGNVQWRNANSLAGDNLGNHIATTSITPSVGGTFNLGAGMLGFRNAFFTGSVFLDDLQFLDNTNGNVALGNTSLDAISTGVQNVSIGGNTLANTDTGSGNVAIGFGALNTNSAGTNNTAVGTGAGPFTLFGAPSLTNTTAIGSGARVSNSNHVRIGNSSVVSIGGYAAWSNLSDGRFKKNVKEDVSGLEFIEKLRPVSYEIEEDKLRSFLHEEQIRNPKRSRQVGFIAQEVEKAVDDNGLTFSGVEKPASENEHYSLQYSQFVVPLTKAVQELSAMVKDQQKQIASLQKMLSAADANFAPDNSRAGFQLLQNHPNPFSTNTVIELTLPDAVQTASIVIHDLRGMEMKRIPLTTRGATTVTIEANELNAGMYLYSLVADGQLIDTKRMLLMD